MRVELKLQTVSSQQTETEETAEPEMQQTFHCWMRLSRQTTRLPLRRRLRPIFALGLAADDTKAYRVPWDGEAASLLRAALEDETLPKSVHDLKTLLRTTQSHGVQLAGVRDDVMLYSYLLNPTHSTHRLEDVAARFDNQSLRGEGEEALPMAAATIARLAPQLRRAVEDSDTLKVYETIDLPLTPFCWIWKMPASALILRICSEFLNDSRNRCIPWRNAFTEIAGIVSTSILPSNWEMFYSTKWRCPSPSSTVGAKLFPQRRMCWRNWPSIMRRRAWCWNIAS